MTGTAKTGKVPLAGAGALSICMKKYLDILLVDDRAENLLALEAVLSAPEYRLVQARSGQEALDALKDHDFLVILLDIQMPLMDGFETARLARETPRGRRVPIIFVTALDRDPRYVELGYNLGAVDYVFKPYEPTVLQAKVKLLADLKEAEESLKSSRSFLDSVVENIPNMVFVKDAKDLRFVGFNKAGEELLGYSREELMGKNHYDFFPKEQADQFVSKDRQVLQGNSIVDIPEEAIETRHKGTRIIHTRKIPIRGMDGQPQYLLGISEDITEQKRIEKERLEAIRAQAALEERKRENERATFLAEASTILAASLDYHQTLKELAALAVPTLADWCTVTIIREDGSKERVAAVHRDPKKKSLIDELSNYSPVQAEQSPGIAQVIRSGKSLFTAVVHDRELVAAAKDERHLAVMRELGCSSCLVVPIKTRGKVLGAISLVSNRSSFVYSETDLALAEELGRRAGIAIENAALYEAAQRAIRTRDEFISIASHELKTPITSLKLQLQITRRATNPETGMLPTPEKLAKVLDGAQTQINRLTKLVDDLLDVSRIESGKLSFNFEILDLSEVVQEMAAVYGDHLLSFGCALDVKTPGPVRVWADRFRLEQVILNLLSNATKYGAGQPVELSVAVAGDQVELRCRDFGMGIPKDKVDRIFERFERAITANNISGLGLGLYITREIVHGHSGTIRVESDEGQGSTFTVRLPSFELPGPAPRGPVSVAAHSQQL